MENKLSRAQRRRLAKELSKQQINKLGSEYIEQEERKKTPQLKLMLSCLTILTACISYSIISGMELWNDFDIWITYMAWGVLISILLGGIVGWIKYRKTFVWSRRWTLGMFVGILGSILFSLFMALTFEHQILKSRFSNHLDNYTKLIEDTEQWTQGSRLPRQCVEYRREQDNLIDDIFNNDKIPTSGEINLLFSIEKVLYSSGCDDRWEDLKSYITKPNIRLKTKYPYSFNQMKTYSYQLYPSIYEGCIMEQNRNKLSHNEREQEMFNEVCMHVNRNDETLWTSGQYAREIQNYIDFTKE